MVDDADRGRAVVAPVRPEPLVPDEVRLDFGSPGLQQAKALLQIGVDVREVVEEQSSSDRSVEARLRVAPVERAKKSLHGPVDGLPLLGSQPYVSIVFR